VSVSVDLQALEPRIADFGPAAFLITVSAEGLPHVVSAMVTWQPQGLDLRVGRHSSANLLARPTLTLLWPAAPGGDYSLLVDGQAAGSLDPEGGPLTVRPTSAVLHRVADASGSGPTCLPVGPTDGPN
jgi:hypothetical protein